MSIFSKFLSLSVLGASLCFGAMAQQALPPKPVKPYQQIRGQTATVAPGASQIMPELLAAAREKDRIARTTSCFASRANILLVAGGLVIYCDREVVDGEGRVLSGGSAVPQAYYLDGRGEGSLSPQSVIAMADLSMSRTMLNDSKLAVDLLVQGEASPTTACPGWTGSALSALGEVQCRKLTQVQSWALTKEEVDLPPRTVWFEVVDNGHAPLTKQRK